MSAPRARVISGGDRDGDGAPDVAYLAFPPLPTQRYIVRVDLVTGAAYFDTAAPTGGPGGNVFADGAGPYVDDAASNGAQLVAADDGSLYFDTAGA